VNENRTNSDFDNEYFRIRLEKRKKIQEAGINIYPDRFPDSQDIGEVFHLPEGAENIRTAGRLVSMRKMGKLIISVKTASICSATNAGGTA